MQTVAACFGLAVIASGCWRYFGADGGDKGLWFGIVMGGLALIGALAPLPRKVSLGLVWSSVLLVAGWFAYECFVRKGWAEAELRQLLVLGLAIVTGGILLRLGSQPSPTGDSS